MKCNLSKIFQTSLLYACVSQSVQAVLAQLPCWQYSQSIWNSRAVCATLLDITNSKSLAIRSWLSQMWTSIFTIQKPKIEINLLHAQD